MSIFLGAQLEDVVEQLAKGAASASKKGGSLELGVTSLPVLPQGRHRPQPDLAVRLHRQQVRVPRGRLVGARSTGRRRSSTRPSPTRSRSSPTSWRSSSHGDFDGPDQDPVGRSSRTNKQVLFEGNNYSEEWHAEAARRGLPNNRTHRRRAAGADHRQGQEGLLASSASSPSASSRPASRSTGSATSRSQNIEANCALDIAKTMILPAAVAVPGPARWRPGTSKGVVATVADKVASLADELVDAIHALEHAQHAAHEAELGSRRGHGVRGQGHPGPERAARRGRRARDAGRPTSSGRCRSTGSCCSSTEVQVERPRDCPGAASSLPGYDWPVRYSRGRQYAPRPAGARSSQSRPGSGDQVREIVHFFHWCRLCPRRRFDDATWPVSRTIARYPACRSACRRAGWRELADLGHDRRGGLRPQLTAAGPRRHRRA